MTQPSPAVEQLLNLADRAEKGLTPDEAARLRDGITTLVARAEKAERAVDHLTDRYRGAEAEVERLRAAAQQLLDNGAKAISEQNWARHHAEERADRAEAALESVRAELAAINLEVGRHRGNGDPETLGYRLGLAAAERQLRAALAPQEPQP